MTWGKNLTLLGSYFAGIVFLHVGTAVVPSLFTKFKLKFERLGNYAGVRETKHLFINKEEICK